MPLAGFEPVLTKVNSDLNAARLPIPPQGHVKVIPFNKILVYTTSRMTASPIFSLKDCFAFKMVVKSAHPYTLQTVPAYSRRRLHQCEYN